jgi:hypothetical protein
MNRTATSHVNAPNAFSSRLVAVGLGLAATPALAGPQAHQFADSISGFGVVRHEVPAADADTWAVSIATQGDAQMFVSTDSTFRPHDAACAGDSTCTIQMNGAEKLYVFVLAESDASYDVIATPTKVSAQR